MSNKHPRQMLARLLPVTVLLAALSLSLFGCSKEELKDAYNSAAAKTQELAAPAMEQIEQALPETGSVTLDLSPVAEMKSADIALLSIGDGKNVVQIMTYDPASSTRTYPAMLLQGVTSASSASALSGEVKCDMYYHSSSTAPIAMTKPNGSVIVNFTRFDAEKKTVHASLGMADLIASDGKSVMIPGGSLIAVISEGGN